MSAEIAGDTACFRCFKYIPSEKTCQVIKAGIKPFRFVKSSGQMRCDYYAIQPSLFGSDILQKGQ